MIYVKSEQGVCEVNMTGSTRDIVFDTICGVMAIYKNVEKTNPAAAHVLKSMLQDDETYSKFDEAVQKVVEVNEKNRKIAEKVINIRKEMEKDD